MSSVECDLSVFCRFLRCIPVSFLSQSDHKHAAFLDFLTGFSRETTASHTQSRFPASDRASIAIDRGPSSREASRNPSSSNTRVCFRSRNLTRSRAASHARRTRSSRSCSIHPRHRLPRFRVTPGGESRESARAIFSRCPSSTLLPPRVSPLLSASLSTSDPPRTRTVDAPYDPRCRVAVSHAARRYTPPHGVVIVA